MVCSSLNEAEEVTIHWQSLLCSGGEGGVLLWILCLGFTLLFFKIYFYIIVLAIAQLINRCPHLLNTSTTLMQCQHCSAHANELQV